MLSPRLQQGIRVARELGLETGLRSTGRATRVARPTSSPFISSIAKQLSLMNPTAEQAFPAFAKEITALKEARDTLISLTPAGLADDIAKFLIED